MKYFKGRIIGLVCLVMMSSVLFYPNSASARMVRVERPDKAEINRKKRDLEINIGDLLFAPKVLAEILLPILNKLAQMQDIAGFEVKKEIKDETHIPLKLKDMILYPNVKYWFASTLYKVRIQKRYSIEKLSELSGIRKDYLRDYEKAEWLPPSIELLIIIEILELELKSPECIELLKSFQAAKLRNTFEDQMYPDEIADGISGAIRNPNAVSDFGEYLRILRNEKEFTAEELAKRVGLDYSTISKFEIGEFVPKREKFEKIEQALGLKGSEEAKFYVMWLDAFVRHKGFNLKIKNINEAVEFFFSFAPEELEKIIFEGILGDHINLLYDQVEPE